MPLMRSPVLLPRRRFASYRPRLAIYRGRSIRTISEFSRDRSNTMNFPSGVMSNVFSIPCLPNCVSGRVVVHRNMEERVTSAILAAGNDRRAVRSLIVATPRNGDRWIAKHGKWLWAKLTSDYH